MKALLIATTALISVASVVSASPLHTRGFQLSDTNKEFLCNYGYIIHTSAVSYTSSGGRETWVRAAIPVRGRGKTVNEIIVADAPLSAADGSAISVAIYSSGKNGPRRKLAENESVSLSQKCGRVHVPIYPTTLLEKGKRYWIVEKARASASRFSQYFENGALWLYDKTKTQGALQQSGYRNWCSSCHIKHNHYRSPWKPITGGVPFARVRY